MLASRLDIVRTRSTDMLPEIMRVMVPERLLPVLHRSSFNAWKAPPGHADMDSCTDAALDALRMTSGMSTNAPMVRMATIPDPHRSDR